MHSIGLVADTPVVTMQLRKLVDALGQTVTYTLTPEQAYESKPLSPSLWIVISEQAADVFEALSSWSDAPVFITDDMPPEEDRLFHRQWCQRLSDKLCSTLKVAPPAHEVIATVNGPQVASQNFRDVWVLAASLGGPEAVRVFLQHIHPELPVTFVYAQHIEDNFDKMLPKVLGKDSQFRVSFCTQGDKLRKGTVMVYPSHTVAQVDAKGKMHVFAGRSWDKPYTPNINQVIDNVADYYHGQMGIIVFSGMCDDGAEASLALRNEGVPLWAQNPDECICSAMPEAVIKSGLVDFIGTAKELAEQLNQRYAAFISLGNVLSKQQNTEG